VGNDERDAAGPADDESAEPGVTTVATPEQFKALGHPTRHRLLFALGRSQATISQLAASLDSNKGNISHHLKVLADAGLVEPGDTRTVRGGTERYYRRTFRALKYDDPATTEAALRAVAAEMATDPDSYLMLRNLRLTPRRAGQLTAILRDLAGQDEDAHGEPQYGLLLGLYRVTGGDNQAPDDQPPDDQPPGGPSRS
jgi:DNA-binding transcriptional ArsR family regulator